MKKLFLILLIYSLCTGVGKAIQDPLYSQFMTNPYLVNPGLTGTYNYYQILTNNRLQWVGLDGPVTNYISMYGPMVNQPMGIGAYVMSDIVGPESKTTLSATYAYHYPVTEDLKVSLGAMVGVMQHKIDGSKIDLEEDYDPIFKEKEVYQNFKPDASIGAYAWTSIYSGGIAFTNLFGNKLQFEDDTTGSNVYSRMKQHFYAHGSYKYLWTRELYIEPTIILRKVAATPF